MACIIEHVRKCGISIYRARIRRNGIQSFNISFTELAIAEKWVEENEEKFIKNPAKYFAWIALIKSDARAAKVYVRLGGTMELIKDGIILTRAMRLK